MKADHSSYTRARNVSLYGLAIQIVLGLALLLYGIYGHDHVGLTAAAYVLTGAVVWLTLAVLFDQHRRERIETLEAEAFAASDAAASSVFEEGARDLRLAAARLRWMQRFLVPGVSVLVGALLVGLGLLQFRTGRPVFERTEQVAPALPGWAVAIGLIVAFVGFLIARYVSGMGKQKVWANLRGGAAFAVGSALFGLLLAIAHFVEIAKPGSMLRYLVLAFPVAMIVLGAEVFLNFVLAIYQPRKPGEYPRPAFDSRVLGFVAAPDKIAESISEAINYQLGFDVTSSWFYRLISRWIAALAVFAVLVVWGLTSIVVLRPHQQGLLLRFGNVVETLGPGLHFKMPWPVDRVEIPSYTTAEADGRRRVISRTATGVRTIDLATKSDAKSGPILWTNEHATEEIFQIVQPATTPPGMGAGEGRTRASRDLALVSVEVPLRYAVRDVEAYERLAPEGQRDELLRAVGQRELTRYLSSKSVTDVLSGERGRMSKELQERIVAAFTAINPKQDGTPVVDVLFVGIEGVHPPQGARGGTVSASYEQVVEAGQKYHSRLHAARSRAIQTVTRVAGSVETAEAIAAEIDALNQMRENGTTPEAIVEQELKIQRMIEASGGSAAAAIATASAERWGKHMGERARLEQYRGQLAAYSASPAIFRASHYLDALRTIMANARVVIADPVEDLRIQTDIQEKRAGTDVFAPKTSD